MSTEHHERAPESLAKEIWFYSLERRAQSAVLRRIGIVATALAVVLLLLALFSLPPLAAALGAVAAVVVLEAAGFVRAGRQRAAILAQLHDGANPQLVDAVGRSLPNRTVILAALAVAVVVGLVALLIIEVVA